MKSLGLFMPPLTREIAVSVSDFTLAVAVQNLLWGFLQPLAGGLSVRYGMRSVMLFGAACYAAGLYVLAQAEGFLAVFVGAGLLVGTAMACTGPAITLSIAARVVSARRRSTTLGAVSAAGSVGALLAAPLGQSIATHYDWRMGVLAFVAMAAAMVPAAWIAGRSDRVAPPAPTALDRSDSAWEALALALRSPAYVVMSAAYFVCGMQLVFLTTHLPSYLEICGLAPMLTGTALGVIGGFNVLGSLFFGWAGGHWPKLVLLGLIYLSRSLVLAWYFLSPPTAASTLVFAAVMGFLWLGVAPLVAGSVVETFGMRWQAMLQGVAFMSHQLGSFVGAFGGGWIFDSPGSYDLAWRLGVGLGLAAGAIQVFFALAQPPRRLA